MGTGSHNFSKTLASWPPEDGQLWRWLGHDHTERSSGDSTMVWSWMGNQLVSSLPLQVKLHSPVGVHTQVELERSTQAAPQKLLPPRSSQNKLARYPEWQTAHSNSVRTTALGTHRVRTLDERLQRHQLERGSELTRSMSGPHTSECSWASQFIAQGLSFPIS